MNVWELFKPAAVLEILSCFTHNIGTIFSTGAAGTTFLQGSSKLDILLTHSFQFCVRLSLKCDGWWVLFPSLMQRLRLQAELKSPHSFPWPFSHLLCVRGISHHILFSSLKKILRILLVWSNKGQGWNFVQITWIQGLSSCKLRPNTRWVKKAEQRNILEDQEIGQVVITTRILSAGIIHFSKMCTGFSVN